MRFLCVLPLLAKGYLDFKNLYLRFFIELYTKKMNFKPRINFLLPGKIKIKFQLLIFACPVGYRSSTDWAKITARSISADRTTQFMRESLFGITVVRLIQR